MPDPTFADVIRAITKIRKETPDLAWMLDEPGVAKLLIQRASGRIDDQKFTYALYRTPFWKRTSDAQRQWRTVVSIDPAKARRQRQEMTERVRRLMGELGVNPAGSKQKRKGGVVGRTKAAKIADLALYNGWSEDQLTSYLLSLATWPQEGEAPTGGIAVAVNKMRQLEEAYGVTTGDRARFRSAKLLLGGRETTEGYEERLRAQALAKYGQNEELAGVLNRGGTLEDWFGNYRQMISKELEVPEAEISMNDQRWNKILMSKGEDGRVRPMTYDEALRFTRSQDEWGSTRGAQEQAATFTNELLKTFGKAA